ncbi:GlyGly-CTERM sorting domain-containing protein [Clostridium sp. AM58-1XD]|nr:GlyGly-CTERM sorting domain-containing protein [Clostridium sp. AM58-1XD]
MTIPDSSTLKDFTSLSIFSLSFLLPIFFFIRRKAPPESIRSG